MDKTSTEEVHFPTEPGRTSHDMRRLNWVLYGPPGIGKSTFVSQASGVLFLTTDDGLKFIRSMSRPIRDWAMFKRYVRGLTAEQPSQYTSICLDNVDSIFKMCRKYICEKRGIEHQSDEQWGKAYDLTSSEFEIEIVKLIALQKYGLFFISHSVDKELKTRLATVTKTMPTMTNQAYKIIVPIVDIMAYYGFDGNVTDDGEQVRRMYFQPTESMDAKDRTTKLPESVKIPDPAEVNGFELVERYLTEPGEAGRPVRRKVVVKKK
jgi:GTPase SAR1 family protein